jgi:hypothetical protein
MNLYEYDFDGSCAPYHNVIRYKTFSVGIFQWLPKSGGKGLKKSPVIVKICGRSDRPGEVYEKAHEICGRLRDGEYEGPRKLWVRK